MTDKIEIERTNINLEADKAQLLEEKNSLVVKREEFRVEIVVMNVAKFSNVLVRSQ